MKPLNAADRRKTFIRFLLFYALTTVLLFVAVFFGMQLPFLQNEKLRSAVAAHEKEHDFQQQFMQQSLKVDSLLGAVNVPGAQAQIIDGQISSGIKSLSSMTTTGDSASQPLYQNMIRGYTNLQLAKSLLRGNADKDANLTDLQAKLTALTNELNACKQTAALQQMQQNMNRPQ